MAFDSRITLYKLEVFSQVVAFESVSRAAEQLYVTQPVVTAHIRSLEERVGAKLFYREGRQLQLSEAGYAVHEWAQDVLTHTRELGRQLEGLSDGSRGGVALAASMSIGSYLLPPALSRFRIERPKVEIQLNVTDSDHAITATEVGECDFAIVYSEHEPRSPGLRGELIGREELVVVAAAHGQPAADSLTVDQLAELDFVDSPVGYIRRTLIDEQLKKVGLRERRVAIQVGHPEAMKRAVLSGLGVALLFQSAAEDEIERGSLRRVEIEDARLSVPIYLVHRKGKMFSAAQRDLLEILREEVGARAVRLEAQAR